MTKCDLIWTCLYGVASSVDMLNMNETPIVRVWYWFWSISADGYNVTVTTQPPHSCLTAVLCSILTSPSVLYLMNCPQWNILTFKTCRLSSFQFSHKTAEEKTSCWLCCKHWSNFKGILITWKDLPDFTKTKSEEKSTSLSLCVFDRERCMCVFTALWRPNGLLCIPTYFSVLKTKKGAVQEDQTYVQSYRKETFILTQGFWS